MREIVTHQCSLCEYQQSLQQPRSRSLSSSLECQFIGSGADVDMKTGDKSEAGFQSCNLDSAKCVSESVREVGGEAERETGRREEKV